MNKKTKKFHEMIDSAKQAVNGVDEPWASVAFGVYLSKIWDLDTSSLNSDDLKSKIKTPDLSTNIDEKKEMLANKCNIAKTDLEKVIDIHNNNIEVIYPVQGNEAQKHLIGAQIVLIASESLFDLDWTSSSILIECLRGMGVTDLANVSLTLKKHQNLIRSRGTRGHKEYKLTSSLGRQSAYDLIRKLVKGEKLDEN